MNAFITVNEPLLNGNEKKYLQECIDTGWISSEGPFVKKLENEFGKLVNRKHGIAVCNGSAALDVAVKSLGVGPGDEIIMPAFTIISCAAAIVRTGATPVLVDSEYDTWNIDISKIEAKITSRTKAIMIVHIYGLPVDYYPVKKLADNYNLKIIEDAAEEHGQFYYDKPCGSLGDISTFSFYPNKHITTGEGGIIVTDDDKLAELCRSYRDLCFKKERRFIHEELGWNYRMSNLQAAVGVAQMERLTEFVLRKKEIGHLYDELLKNETRIEKPLRKKEFAGNIYWVYGIVLKNKGQIKASDVMARLADKGIGSRPFFYPMHLQPVFKKMGLFTNESYPVAEALGDYGFYLPSGLGITDEQIKISANMLIQTLDELGVK